MTEQPKLCSGCSAASYPNSDPLNTARSDMGRNAFNESVVEPPQLAGPGGIIDLQHQLAIAQRHRFCVSRKARSSDGGPFVENGFTVFADGARKWPSRRSSGASILANSLR